MKTRMYAWWIGLLGLALLISACSQTSQIEVVEIPAVGDIVTERYDLAGFTEVEIAGFFEAEVTQGEDFRVLVEAERALVPYLEIDVRGDLLQVGLKSGITYNFENASQRVEVTLPALTLAKIGNHSELQLTGFGATENLQLEVVDFSTLNGSVEAETLQVEVTNHSTLTLSGSASQVMGEVTNHSSADLTGLQAAEANIDTDTQSTLRQ
ncbi:MAG: hypothetical protein AMJ88_16210 [Anaerolineae bacterium SM23_ 63]|nr:MAG: hypothetical protein AMJ88_16210 [Anaerolineae bacterium SM23_ 63]HEY45371.1 hypothetical protein [Anaerolineae bacterium]